MTTALQSALWFLGCVGHAVRTMTKGIIILILLCVPYGFSRYHGCK